MHAKVAEASTAQVDLLFDSPNIWSLINEQHLHAEATSFMTWKERSELDFISLLLFV